MQQTHFLNFILHLFGVWEFPGHASGSQMITQSSCRPSCVFWVLNIGGQAWQQVPFIHNQAFYNKLYCG